MFSVTTTTRHRPAAPPGVARSCRSGAAAGLALVLCGALVSAEHEQPAPGQVGGAGLAIRASKVLTVAAAGPGHIDDGLVLVRDEKIVATGRVGVVEIPEGYQVLDAGDNWLMPGLIDLHSHVGGTRGYNDMVYQANPGLRISTCVIPHNPLLKRAVAAGVTTILFIPGSGTNIGGQGVLMKTALDRYEDALVRNPGSMKVAQGDNPTRWGYGMGRLLMNWTLRRTFDKGLVYARAWEAFEGGIGPKPEMNLQLEIFRHLYTRATQISTHTQYYQLVMMSIQMLAVDYPFDAFIDHGSFDSYLNADRADAAGVAAILGPRQVMYPRPPRFDTDGRVEGSAWGFQKEGHSAIGFNTDAGVIWQELLGMQASMAVRYGFDDRRMDTVRGLTIVPAQTAGIAGLVGSLEPGKHADIVEITGHPADPRCGVERVWIQGTSVYDAERDRRRF